MPDMGQIPSRENAQTDPLYVQNISGGDLAPGDLVMISVASDTGHVAGLTVLKATAAADERAVGVVLGRSIKSDKNIPDDGFGYVAVGGLATVSDDGDTAEGDEVVVSSVAGVAATAGDVSAGTRVLGVALAASASNKVPVMLRGLY